MKAAEPSGSSVTIDGFSIRIFLYIFYRIGAVQSTQEFIDYKDSNIVFHAIVLSCLGVSVPHSTRDYVLSNPEIQQ